MTKGEYIKRLRREASWAKERRQAATAGVLRRMADEMESMDMVWVPREPTEEMIEAGRQLQSIGDEELYVEDMRMKWEAMLNAAENTND